MSTSHEQLERIVAYLDGELSAEESAQVEQQLASDEGFRQELQGAERAWSALDQLPMATVGDEFSRTTMDLVVDAARQDVEAKTVMLPIQQRKSRKTSWLLLAMAMLLGALMFRVLWNNPNRLLLADLPVIKHVDVYSHFDDVQFLRDLERELDGRLQPSSVEVERINTNIQQFKLVSASDDRDQWLESLPEDEKVSLRAKLNRFRNLSISKRAELRSLQTELDSANDREQLLTTMFQYQGWLNDLTPSEQYQVRVMPTEDRARLVARDMMQTEHLQQLELTAEELQELFKKVRPHVAGIVAANRPAFEKYMSQRSQRERKGFRSLSTPEQNRRELQFAMMQSPKRIKKLVDTVSKSLPAEAGDAFEQLPPREKMKQIQAWIRQLHLSGKEKGRGGKVSEEELEQFFVDDLEPAERERLLALPREQMQVELRRLYFGKRARPGSFGRPQWAGPPDGRGRFDDRRGPGGRRPDGPEPGPPRGDRRRPEFDGPRDRRPNRPPYREPDRDRPRRGRPPGDRPPDDRPLGGRPPGERPPLEETVEADESSDLLHCLLPSKQPCSEPDRVGALGADFQIAIPLAALLGQLQ